MVFFSKVSLVKVRMSPVKSRSFYWHYKGNLSGIFMMHVDDFLWGGSDEFEAIVIFGLRKEFKVENQASGAFKYIGLEIGQTEEGITLHQES